jgi:hypothetical protein
MDGQPINLAAAREQRLRRFREQAERERFRGAADPAEAAAPIAPVAVADGDVWWKPLSFDRVMELADV